ncbi:ABC transporter ATP-binding protein [uncultured Algibacter sp.]|jgi:putative ABC transport system ATP-binding protein|uniref:ABC transporter ATP-binding protein n=1 Tax=Flagellimonas alginolytica TaxID=3177515 RepID=UPI001CE22EBB|nr:ABC transporter ATP-binding protein [Mesoflavibacter sp.]UBZ13290.1 ABC transporter ATP-binding protein [Allomuricauda aquimarina]|tara:strand:- start:45 stop:728 length:684 start_codon:yes stop_codon:yes gene_type:complete
MNVIKTENLTKVYNEGKGNEVRALNGVSLAVEKGEFTAIVGPSGSGKSTMLNIIGGLDKPNSGEVLVDKTDIIGMKENELINFRLQNIGFVFQAYNLIPVLNAKENVGFIMLLQHKSKEEIDNRVESLLKSVGLESQASKRPNEMSGGQQQRIAVARALASKPKFVLADEPTANLDSKSTSDLLDIMEQLNEKEGITFVFSTHDQRVIDRAHRIVTLEDGKIIKDTK